jgi:hypothetical protein
MHGEPTLRTLADVRAFMVELPENDQMRNAWQRAAELLLAAAAAGGHVAAASKQ